MNRTRTKEKTLDAIKTFRFVCLFQSLTTAKGIGHPSSRSQALVSVAAGDWHADSNRSRIREALERLKKGMEEVVFEKEFPITEGKGVRRGGNLVLHDEASKRIKKLREEIDRYRYEYHVLDRVSLV